MAFYEPLVRVGADGSLVDIQTPSGAIPESLDPSRAQIASGSLPDISMQTTETAGGPDTTVIGNLADSSLYNIYGVTLTAGTTYTFAERGTGTSPLVDPLLLLADSGGNILASDDDGGFGRSAMITFTPTETGTYLLAASSWYQLVQHQPDPGSSFRLDKWISNPATDVGGTFATASEIGLGTTYGNLEAAGDRDMYAIDVTAGQLYTFTYNGGIAAGSDWEDPTTPGESIGVLRLYDSNHNLIAANVDYETGLSFLADHNGTYYLQVDPYETTMTGGYTIDVSGVNPADYDPLDSINWRSAANVPFVDVDGVPTATVYFAPSGENFV